MRGCDAATAAATSAASLRSSVACAELLRQHGDRFCSLCSWWYDLDREVDKTLEATGRKHARIVSGGIFIYPLQVVAALDELEALVRIRGTPTTVCETGFGAGHSSALWLGVPGVRVVSFDMMGLPHQVIDATKRAHAPQ